MKSQKKIIIKFVLGIIALAGIVFSGCAKKDDDASSSKGTFNVHTSTSAS